MAETLTVKEASEMLNVSQQYLRDMMRFNLIDIGIVVKMPNKTNYHYIISKEKLERVLGK